MGYEKILDWPPWKEPLPTRAWLRPSLDDGLSACTHASEPMRALRSNHGCFISINLPRTAVPLTKDLRSKQAPIGTIVVAT